MVPRDKYTVFDRKEKRYRKGIHSMFLPALFCSLVDCWGHGGGAGAVDKETRCEGDGYGEESDRRKFESGHELANTRVCYTEVPKWTRVSQRINPPGF